MGLSNKKPSIFISHSSKDMTIARAVRNLLEDRSHFVGFFGWLQQMDDPEIEAFLDAEIRMHTWLVLIETENAHNSLWVQFEIERAKQYGKVIYTLDAQRFVSRAETTRIDMELDAELRHCVKKLSIGFRIFLSHTRPDAAFAAALHDDLTRDGFEVYDFDLNPPPAEVWQETLKEAIHEVAESGIFVALISRTSLQSEFWKVGLLFAQARNALVLPVIIEAIDPDEIPLPLRQLNWLDVSDAADPNARILASVHALRAEDFTQSCGRIIG